MSGVFEFEMQSSVSIRATPEAVWEVLTAASDWPRWCRVCVDVARVPETWAVGARLGFRLRMAGVSVPFTVAVSVSEPPARLAWESTKFTVTATRTFTLEEAGGATVVTDHKLFRSLVLPVRLFYPRWIIRNMTESWLSDLKREVESRRAGNR